MKSLTTCMAISLTKAPPYLRRWRRSPLRKHPCPWGAAESVPAELDTIADLPRLSDALADWGYDDEAIGAIMGENWLRLLRRATRANWGQVSA
ncbi:MAG: hypothetical protein DCC55_16675 [Chloroflexi bacterium]|nr:MAG: hypothetical protein DCC55_16675 [Chloroflexota bacterium]